MESMLRSHRLISILIAALLLLPFAVSCSSSGNASEPYKIGALFAVTGFNSPLGTPEKETALMLEE
ncbi:MAG: hypothetical protein M0Z94_12685 [Dehalococcoidales bacterium]|nr:hypothetical protein [Dehalococcoidales bacterium]